MERIEEPGGRFSADWGKFVGPADHKSKPDPSNSAAFTSPARGQADSIVD